MNHEQFQDLVHRYLDERLTDVQSAQMFEHLSVCSDCRNLMQSSLRIRSFYQQQEPEEVPSSLDRRVAASAGLIPGTAQRRHLLVPLWTTRLSVSLPLAASIIFLILVGSLLFSPVLFRESTLSGDKRIESLSPMPPEIQEQLQLFR